VSSSRLAQILPGPSEIRLTVLDHGTMQMDARRLAARPECFQRVAHREPQDLWQHFPVISVLVRHPEGTFLLDTGCYSGWKDTWSESGIGDVIEYETRESALLGPALAAEGVRPTHIDAVVLSHLHMDHAGGLEVFSGTGVPILVQEREYEHLIRVQGSRTGAYIRREIDGLDLAWSLCSGDFPLAAGVQVVTLPGHSPGTQGVVIAREGRQTVIFASDAIQVAANVQDGVFHHSANPYDSVAWRLTARELMDAQEEGALVVMGHEPSQSAELEALT